MLRDIAWYFEGEGTVGYYRQLPGGFALQTNICSTNKAILIEFQRVVSGTIAKGHKKGDPIGKSGYFANKTSWKLEWSHQKALRFLTSILPFFPSCSEKLPQIRYALQVGSMASESQMIRMKAMKKEMPVIIPFKGHGQENLPFEETGG